MATLPAGAVPWEEAPLSGNRGHRRPDCSLAGPREGARVPGRRGREPRGAALPAEGARRARPAPRRTRLLLSGLPWLCRDLDLCVLGLEAAAECRAWPSSLQQPELRALWSVPGDPQPPPPGLQHGRRAQHGHWG